MFTNQKILGILLILFIVLGTGYFAYSKFTTDITNATASPSPSPQALDFAFNKNGANSLSDPQSGASQFAPKAPNQAAPQATELPLSKNKKLSQFPGLLKPDVLENKAAVIQTQKGMIALKIYPEASMAASNFILLAANGFYDNLVFHRVEDWVIQGGDPEGTGRGGPGYQFPDEPVTKEYKTGIVAMANSGPNTNGSQFFIMKKDQPLPPNYTIFGEVLQGMDVVGKISVGDVIQKVTIQNLQ
jgi:cyclophilin family peptidyl-prolyl cis-trans isomerase